MSNEYNVAAIDPSWEGVNDVSAACMTIKEIRLHEVWFRDGSNHGWTTEEIAKTLAEEVEEFKKIIAVISPSSLMKLLGQLQQLDPGFWIALREGRSWGSK